MPIRLNDHITAPQVRVIGPDGRQLGIMSIQDAIKLARSHGLDLVEIAATAKPPVVRIVDFSKWKAELKRKAEGDTPPDLSKN